MHLPYAPCDISASIPSHKSTCLHWLIANSYLARTRLCRVQSQPQQAPLKPRRGAPRDALFVCALYTYVCMYIRCLHFSQFCKKFSITNCWLCLLFFVLFVPFSISFPCCFCFSFCFCSTRLCKFNGMRLELWRARRRRIMELQNCPSSNAPKVPFN